jgi:protocatechuate 3,4-dioxygenase beta subunit
MPPGVNPTAYLQSLRPQTVTGSNGQFLFENITAGRTSISYSKPGYVSQSITYPFVSGVRTSGVVVRMQPTGVVSGRVFDRTGKPAIGIRVEVFGFATGSNNTPAYAEMKRMGLTTTNDHGEYRFIELLPNRYIVSFQMPTDNRPGRESVSPEPALLYPGVDLVSKAEFISVKGNAEVQLKDMTFPSGSGLGEVHVHLSNGEASSREIAIWFHNMTRWQYITNGTSAGSTPLRPDSASLLQERILIGGSAQIDRTFWPTVPGRYEAGARWKDANGIAREIARSIDYRGGDVDVALTIEPPEGRIEIHTPDGITPVTLTLCETKTGCLGVTQGTRVTAEKGVGKVGGLEAGRYYVTAITNLADQYVASLQQSGKDAFVEGVIVSKDAAPVEIVFRSGKQAIHGKIVDAQGRAIVGALVGLLPDTPLDQNPLWSLRRQARTDKEGQFEFSGLLPGPYRVYAWNSAREDIFIDPDFATTFKDQGTRISVEENGQPSITLKVLD